MAVAEITTPDLSLKLTGIALDSATADQVTALLDIAKRFRSALVSVYVDFSLPTGYLGFCLYKNERDDVAQIYGGVDADGSIST